MVVINSEYTGNYGIVYFKKVKCMVCELLVYLIKAVILNFSDSKI